MSFSFEGVTSQNAHSSATNMGAPSTTASARADFTTATSRCTPGAFVYKRAP
ncbi:hypothetical protein [Sphingomonas sp. CROZ-RG-20F-R02-07]|uniref:hypothetical protein n=1 Tax=Sphingomonas sp. CROZ-RG-20F-R02-07 TaxID=2914832 RepID=UPI001F5775DF|nr:hypothetical protein [Sphingomonas sp. CROZ-RG-20F-R02-07]